jgi:hypothetical protein
MKKTTSTYLRQLGFWLRFQGVDGPRIVMILSEARTHVAESGEDPYETFGEPRVYARAFAEGSRRRWLWGAFLVIALGTFTVSIYLFASEVASRHESRPLPLGGHAWVVIALAVVAALVAWRACLIVVVRPFSSLAYDDGEASSSWRTWVVQRRYVTVVVVIAIVAGSALWGQALGTSFVNSPQLRASNYVWANASGGTPTLGENPVDVAVSTVIYVAHPGPTSEIVYLSLSKQSAPNYDQSSNLIPYPTLASADRAAHDHDFSGIDDNAPRTTLTYGTYYVLEYFGQIDTTYNTLDPAESLNVGYSVNGVANRLLTIALPLNYEGAN